MPPSATQEKRGRSLAGTIARSALALIAVILLVSSTVQIYFDYLAQRRVVAEDEQQIAENAAEKVRNFVQRKFDILSVAAAFSRLDRASTEERLTVMNRLLGREPAFRQLLLYDLSRQRVASAERLFNLPPVPVTDTVLNEIFVELGKGRVYFGPVYIDPVTSEPMAIMALPVTDEFGDHQGAFLAEINLKFTWDLVSGLMIGEGGLAYLIDRQGEMIAFKDISRVLARENLAHLEPVKLAVSGVDAGDTATISRGILGTTVVATYVPLGFPDWSVVVELPVREAYANIFRLALISVLALLISFAIAVIGAPMLSASVTRPIVELRDAAALISEGKMDTRIDTASDDEIGQLARTFNNMASALQKSHRVLEVKVTDRTLELQQKVKELEHMNRVMIGRELKMIEMKKTLAKLGHVEPPDPPDNQKDSS